MTSRIFKKFRSEGGKRRIKKFLTFSRLFVSKKSLWWQLLCPHSIPPGFKLHFLCFFAISIEFDEDAFSYSGGSGGQNPPENFWEF